jgi:outer membrane lipoprotein LolB
MRHIPLILCLVAALVGCSTPPVKLTPQEKDQVYDRFERSQKEITYWQMNGRFSLRVDNHVHTGNITWVNNGASYGIKFSGPLDQSAVVITSDGKTVTMKDNQGYEGTESTPEALLSRYTQYEMPVSALKYWVLARPAPFKTPSLTLNPQGYPIGMQQDDWTVEYQYFREVGQYLLPSKIIIHHPNMKLTLSIHDWKVSDKPYALPQSR